MLRTNSTIITISQKLKIELGNYMQICCLIYNAVVKMLRNIQNSFRFLLKAGLCPKYV